MNRAKVITPNAKGSVRTLRSVKDIFLRPNQFAECGLGLAPLFQPPKRRIESGICRKIVLQTGHSLHLIPSNAIWHYFIGHEVDRNFQVLRVSEKRRDLGRLRRMAGVLHMST